jgi:DNA-binding Lrp family transcriptional regulator
VTVKAFVLITVDTARTMEVVQALATVPEVRAVHEVMGPYDIVLEMETPQFDDVTAILRQRIRPIQGVRNTLTCVVMRPSVEERHSGGD